MVGHFEAVKFSLFCDVKKLIFEKKIGSIRTRNQFSYELYYFKLEDDV
jgi:hypothetical protein